MKTTADTTTTSDSGPSRRSQPRPRGRSAAVRQAVLAATLDLLSRRGYDAMTTKAIAAQAGVNEATLYRRWGSKAAIVADALMDFSATETPTPDTGTLHTDMVETLKGIITRIQTPLGKVIDQIVVSATIQPELEAVRHAYWRESFSKAAVLIQRAKDRGELPDDVDAQLLMEAAIGPLLVRTHATGQPFDAQLPEKIVMLLLYGVYGVKNKEGGSDML